LPPVRCAIERIDEERGKRIMSAAHNAPPAPPAARADALSDTKGSAPASAEQTAETLRRILDAVERDQRKRWVDIAAAAVLALATTASAWCAYQSSRWGGVQVFQLAEAARADRAASAIEIESVETRTFDAILVVHALEHREAGRPQLADRLFSRLRPDARAAVDAWLATDPFDNPKAPLGPFVLPQYGHEARQKMESLRAEADAAHVLARAANRHSDNYVLLTVLFAAVLFCGGIAATIDHQPTPRRSMQVMAVVLFVLTVGFLLTMPVCRQ
jgi:hypothetical protein